MVKYLVLAVTLEYEERAVGPKVPAGERGPGWCGKPSRVTAAKPVFRGLDTQWRAVCSLTLAGFWIVNLYVNIIVLEKETLSNFF